MIFHNKNNNMKVIFKSVTRYQGSTQEIPVCDFGYTDTEAKELFDKFENDELSIKQISEFEQQAIDAHDVSWWLEIE